MPLTVYIPCVIAGPMGEVIAAYGATHTEVEIRTDTDKPLALVGRVEEQLAGPAAIVTMGDVEMNWLVGAGAVDAADVCTIAVNTYPLVVVAAAQGASEVGALRDLAGPGLKRILVEDPARSSLGDRTGRAFKQLGLWEEIAPKIARPNPKTMVLGELVAGKADAAVVFRDCLFGEGDFERSVPKTIRIIGELPDGAYPPIFYQAAPLRGKAHPEAARAFVQFLVSPEGRRALQDSGLALAELP